MSTATVVEGKAAGTRARYWRGHRVVLPNPRDPRLAQSAVLLSLQVLGQTVLHFPLSVAQILVSLATCALLDAVITFVRHDVIMWPASALLTGNGVALLLRHPGTVAGDRWDLGGWWLFAGVAAASLLSKHLLRYDGRHVFNPSNVGLVAAYLLLGSSRADAQLLYWGPWRAGLAVAVALIVGGAVVVGRRAGVLAVAVVYLACLAAGLGVLSGSGHCIVAVWHPVPLCGATFWWRIALSPETLVFAAFMVTDPRTVPGGRGARLVFAALAAGGGALVAAPQNREFATKVAILGGLTLASAALLAARVVARRLGPAGAGFGRWLDGAAWRHGDGAAPADPPSATRPRPVAWARATVLAVLAAGLGASAIVAAGAPARRSDLAVATPAAPGGGDEADRATVERATPPWPPGVGEVAISIDRSVARWAPWFRPVDAETRSRALIAALEDERRQRGEAQPDYLAVTVLMVRVPGSAQDAPEVGYQVERRSAPTGTDPASSADPAHHTDWYRLTSEGETFVIAGPGEPWTD